MPSRPLSPWPLSVSLFSLAVAISGPALRAQDVTVGEPVWLLSTPAPEVMPKTNRPFRPAYPPELSKISEPGYVIVIRYVDAAGENRALRAQGTHIPFQRSVEATVLDGKITPAMRGGAPVVAEFWFPVIFNPKTAGKDAPDHPPRLLAVAPVFLPARQSNPAGPQAVRMHLDLDETGAITRATPADQVSPALLAAVNAALKQWRFAPGRVGGRPVGAEMTVPVLLCEHLDLGDGEQKIPPKLISRVNPVYPQAMAMFGIQGRVDLSFVVDREGVVRNPVVESSNNPAFDEPAMDALLKWKFQPAMVGGKKVNTRVNVPIVFGIEGGGKDIFQINGHVDQSKLPPELRYDQPPKIRGVQVPVYPYEQRRDGQRGKAAAAMLIDTLGRVSSVIVRSADRPEFGLALTAALEGFAFDPAMKDGKPVAHYLNFAQTFDDNELPDFESADLLSLEHEQSDKIVSAKALDARLKPISRRAPAFPTGLGVTVTKGEAVVECLIDGKGHVHLPRITKASEPAFGYAAVQAVSTWRFEPPRREGKPVITRVQIPFAFEVAPDPGHGILDKPVAQLTGHWSGVDAGGKKGEMHFYADGRVMLVIDGKKLGSETPDAPAQVTYGVDATTSPWHLDILARINDLPLGVLRGLLEIVDDTTIRVGLDPKGKQGFGDPRPARFSDLGSGSIITLKREEPGDSGSAR